MHFGVKQKSDLCVSIFPCCFLSAVHASATWWGQVGGHSVWVSKMTFDLLWPAQQQPHWLSNWEQRAQRSGETLREKSVFSTSFFCLSLTLSAYHCINTSFTIKALYLAIFRVEERMVIFLLTPVSLGFMNLGFKRFPEPKDHETHSTDKWPCKHSNQIAEKKTKKWQGLVFLTTLNSRNF